MSIKAKKAPAGFSDGANYFSAPGKTTGGYRRGYLRRSGIGIAVKLRLVLRLGGNLPKNDAERLAG